MFLEYLLRYGGVGTVGTGVVMLFVNVIRYGGLEAATFCALMTLFDAIQHEACVDIYTVCKLYHTKRPNVFPTEVSNTFNIGFYSCTKRLRVCQRLV